MQVFLCIKGYVVSFYHNICIVAAQCFIWLYKMDKMKNRKTENPEKQKTEKPKKRKTWKNQPDRQENKKKLLYYIHLIYNKYAS